MVSSQLVAVDSAVDLKVEYSAADDFAVPSG